MSVSNFITESSHARTPEGLFRLFAKELEQYGYHPFLQMTPDGPQYLAMNEPAPEHIRNFIAAYHSGQYIHSDVVFKLYAGTFRPFSWREAMKLAGNKAQKQAMFLRLSTGCVKGVCIPLRNSALGILGVSVASFSKETLEDGLTISSIYALVNLYLLRLMEIKNTPLQLPGVQLSSREQEVLSWCARGKTNNVISDIIGISERTVEFHLHSVFKKLHVDSRIMAVVKALSLCIIDC